MSGDFVKISISTHFYCIAVIWGYTNKNLLSYFVVNKN